MFLIRPKIINGESLASYVYRVAHANFYDSITPVSLLLGMPTSKMTYNDFYDEEIEKLSFLTKQERDTLSKMSLTSHESQLGFALSKKIIQRDKVKFCPRCIQEQNHHKLAWFFRPLAICLQHGIFLVDSCPKCSVSVKLKALITGCCESCGYTLSIASRRNSSPCEAIIYSQSHLMKLFDQQKVTLSHWSTISHSDFFYLADRSFHLLSGLTNFVDSKPRTIKPFYNKKSDPPPLAIDYAYAYANVVWMYEEFPTNFYLVLEVFYSKEPRIKYIQKAQFEQLFSREQFNFIQNAYNEYWIDKADKGLIRKDFSIFKENTSLLEKRAFLSKEEIQEKWGISGQRIKSLGAKEAIKIHKVSRGKMDKYTIDKSSLEDMMSKRKRFITKKDAAEMLGIHPNSIRKLINGGILIPEQTPNGNLIKLQEVKQLKEKYKGELVTKRDESIGFQEAMVTYSVHRLNLISLLQFIDQGLLHPLTSKKEGNWRDLHFDKSEMLQCVSLLKSYSIK